MRKTSKAKSIQSTLFITYFFILFGVLLCVMTFFVVSEARKLQRAAFSQISQNAETLSSYIDEETKILDTVALNISYSNLIKERFSNYADYADTDSVTNQTISYNNIQNTKELIDMLTAILGPNQPVVQIYLYSLDKGVFGVGLDTSTTSNSVKDYPWYDQLIADEFSRLLTCDYDKRLEKFYSYEGGASFITLYQMYYNSYNIPQGIIEVKNPISLLNDKIKNIIKNYNESIYIFDTNGHLVYPGFSDTMHADFYQSISAREAMNEVGVNYYKYDNNTYIFYKTSDKTKFTVATVVRNSDLFQPIYEYIRINLIILLVIGLATLFLSFIAARIITTPITKIFKQVQSFRLDLANTNQNFPDIDTHIIEFNTLYSALVTMQKKSQESMEREITLQNQEMQSRMLALQSQMNPHFLYNSLATIQTMADEKMNDEIQLMCQNVSHILRYISSDKQLLVPLYMELNHTLDYLQCMKIRYNDDLVYEIQVPDEMKNIHIPKLCVQLIVENSIKFSTKSVRPPWKVSIRGTITKTHWELAISDNGKGFSDSEIEDLNQKIDVINKTGLLPNLEISGMGLMNIYIRFKILYKGSHIFRINNLALGGAQLTIGGIIDENRRLF